MHPVLFRIGNFEITSFGAMVALGGLLGLLVMRRELARSGIDVTKGTDAAVAGLLGGLAGAKLLYVFEHLDEGFASTLFSRGGMSWFGGLIGGLVAGILFIRWNRLPMMAVLAAGAPGVALGQAIGRIGCFLVGDDYGKPSNLPWAVAFPEGLPPTRVPVHPTQLYEAVVLVAIMGLLVHWRRRGVPDTVVFARYLIMAGATRFAIEFVRVNERILFGFTLAHIVSILVVIAGVALQMAAARRVEAPEAVAPRRA